MTKQPDRLGDETVKPAAFEEVEHTADWALRIRGRDLSELLSSAARGLCSLLSTGPLSEFGELEQQFELEAYDPESLLVGWLNELVYWAEVEGVLFSNFELANVSATRLSATARGRRVAHLEKHIKAVTYHNLEINDTGTGLETTVVFDV